MASSSVPPDFSPPARILALDMLASLETAGLVQRATFAELDADLLARVRADQVILPLLSRGHDAMATVERLEGFGYTGLIIVVAPPLPDARMVEAELRALGPGPRLILLTR